jgi:hypothetical protein
LYNRCKFLATTSAFFIQKEDVKVEVGGSNEESVNFATSKKSENENRKESEDENRLTLIEQDENNNNKQNVNKTKDLIKILPSIETLYHVFRHDPCQTNSCSEYIA